MRIKVENIPIYAEDYEFIVGRPVDGEVWFWGAYDTREKACRVAKDIDGIVVENMEE